MARALGGAAQLRMYSIAAALTRLRAVILEREAHTDWVLHLPEAAA